MPPTGLLVTTSQSLLLIDPDSGTGWRLDEGRGLYYGIAVAGEQILVAARGRLVSSSVPPAAERGQILAFDRHWRSSVLPDAPFPLRDMHQILLYEDQLWVTCCFDNSIAIYDSRRQTWTRWHPLGLSPGEPEDNNHFNSLAIFDQQLCVLAHNRGDSDLLFFQLPERQLIATLPLGNQAHNIWRRGSAWATCSSGVGQLVSTDGWVVDTGGFPRGMAWVGAETWVGISEIAERGQRDFTTSELHLFNAVWERQRRIALVNEGLVLEVCPLPAGWTPPDSERLTFPVYS